MQNWILDVLKQAIGTLLAIGIILIPPIRDRIVKNSKLSFDKALEDKESLSERKNHTSKTMFDNRYAWIVVWAVISIIVACVVHWLFKNVAPYCGPMPTYPGGYWSWGFCSNDVEIPLDYTKIDEKRAQEISKTCKIYNRKLHSAVFCVPNFVSELANG